MSTITIEQAEEQLNKLTQMLADLKASAARVLGIPSATIQLAAGERYAGIALDAEGFPSHHLILLPGEAESVEWPDAIEWATQAGGELPTRQEQALLYANLKDLFKPNWYWSSEQHASDSDYAWYQDFDNGCQGNCYKGAELRARAVRRLPIQ